MRLTLRQLHIFTAVAGTGSTTAGGLRVALSQSATSGALNELEALLGAPLFDRIGKRLVLNDTGRALLPQARALLDAAHGIENQFGIGDAGTSAPLIAPHLRVGASTTIGNYLLPALVASHLRASPATAIDVTIGNTSDIAAAVARLEVDVGLIEGPRSVGGRNHGPRWACKGAEARRKATHGVFPPCELCNAASAPLQAQTFGPRPRLPNARAQSFVAGSLCGVTTRPRRRLVLGPDSPRRGP